MTLTIGSLFSGIGGLELGLERATGARTIWQVERDPFCQRVLAKHWPDATRYDDVCTASALPFVDVMCGGFPCQDISVAGKGAGIDGERSGLWREYARIIDETKPRTVVVENVAVIASRGLARVLHDLAGLGYMGTWGVVAAASVGAPHLRRRLFVVAAHPERVELRDKQGWRSGACWARAREPRHLGEAGPAAHTDVQHLDVPARPQRDEAPDVVGPGSGGSAADADVNAGGPRGLITPAKAREGGTLIKALSARGAAGSLHPQFVEWMMGFPPGWTDLDDDDLLPTDTDSRLLATPSSRRLPESSAEP